jgi:hypothetical protein
LPPAIRRLAPIGENSPTTMDQIHHVPIRKFSQNKQILWSWTPVIPAFASAFINKGKEKVYLSAETVKYQNSFKTVLVLTL